MLGPLTVEEVIGARGRQVMQKKECAENRGGFPKRVDKRWRCVVGASRRFTIEYEFPVHLPDCSPNDATENAGWGTRQVKE